MIYACDELCTHVHMKRERASERERGSNPMKCEGSVQLMSDMKKRDREPQHTLCASKGFDTSECDQDFNTKLDILTKLCFFHTLLFSSSLVGDQQSHGWKSVTALAAQW